ncbi:response regulator transcription factor [Paenibacillus planticolens]|uniref:Response regulator n=1 Tax=Paenibacillus planticolens TaxID=2654976 RepID=A0ABX1ZNT6_9BACL|nr:response regulator [Paenibacillus planticolens]NOV01764.1 response regulator [Paenibacillus planticolens]
MINVVVVEDKHPILRSIVRKIENYSPDLNIAGQFTDGRSALQAIKQLKPHLVFTDIRMPGIDGLKLIAEVKALAPETTFIIISGHEEFDYARQAIQLGVVEYLLKPVTEQSIRDILDKTVPSILMNKQAAEYRIISHAIKRWSSPSQVEYEDLSYESFFVMLICAGSLSKLFIDVANPLHDIWLRTDLKALLSARFPSLQPYWIMDGESMNEAVIVFSSTREQAIDLQAIANYLMEKLSHSNIPATVAISNRVITLSKLKLEYQITRTALRKYLLFGQSSIVFAEDVKWHSPHEPLRKQIYDEQKLVSLFKGRKKKLFFMEIESMLQSWEMSGMTQNAIEDCLYQILYACSKSIVGKPPTDSDLKLELDEVISISNDYPSLLRNTSFLFENVFLQIEHTEPSPKIVKDIMEQVDAYFQRHMSDEISVNDIADRVNLNLSYLSREFKKYKGITPIEYLTQLRIDKAKQLLADESNLKFKDIAPLVGFSNQYYFSRVFKFITGITPTEYKNSRFKITASEYNKSTIE